jgi:hypothetical protein
MIPAKQIRPRQAGTAAPPKFKIRTRTRENAPIIPLSNFKFEIPLPETQTRVASR